MKYATAKFLREYDNVTKRLFADEEFEFGPQYKVKYLMFQQLLVELGFLPSVSEKNSTERDLMFDLWNLLQGEINNGITINNIYKALLGVQGIDPDMNNPDYRLKVPYEEDQIAGFDNDGEFYFLTDIRHVFIKYKPLYVHKVYLDGQ